MNIKAELEALRDKYQRIADGMKPSGSKRVHIEFASDIDAIIARLPPDAVVVRDVGAIKTDTTRVDEDFYCDEAWNACRRAMLQAAEESQE